MTTTNPTIDPAAEDAAYVAAIGELHLAQSLYRNAAENVLRYATGVEAVHDFRGWTTHYTLDGATVTAVDVYDLTPEWCQKAFDIADDALDSVTARVAALRATYDEYRWSRFWLVPGGHLHSSTDCQTCNREGYQTRFALVAELSGQTEAEAVAEMGAVLCTVCYPTAPVEHTDGSSVGRRTQAERDARAAEKAAKLAAKLAKAIIPDGSQLRLRGYDRPATIIATQRAVSSCLQNLGGYGPGHPSASEWAADAQTCAEALAERLGGTAAEILTAAAAKAARKVRSDWGQDTTADEILATVKNLV